MGYRVAEAPDGDRALDMLAADPGIELMLTDIGLPGARDGSALAEEVKRRHPQVKLVFTSGYSERVLLNEGRLTPGATLLMKPYKLDRLADVIAEALDQA